jgi:hypothetical protein
VHAVAPESPKTSASTEILLHLTNNDQTAAAVRVADRGGVVNVSVHAADPGVRESLRSNLGELSAQLNQQGWKAEVTKPALAMASQPERHRDSQPGDQRPAQQQQAFGGERQQRQRHNSGGAWEQELDQQISSEDARSGGKR